MLKKKRLVHVLKILIALVVIIGVGWQLYDSWDKIKEIHWEPNYLLLILAGICYVVAYIPAAVYWRYAMQTLGQQPGIYESFRAYYIGHLGKYVPGKAMVLILRSGLLNNERTKLSVAAASVFLETMTMMAVGAFVAALIAVLWFQQIGQGMQVQHSNSLMLLALGVMCGTMLPILPPVFHFVAKKCRIELEGLRFRTLAVGWLCNIPVWLMLGMSLWITMLGLGIQSNGIFHDVLYCTLAVSMAVVLGFATPIPGGLGAREAAMVLFLVPFFMAHPQMIGTADPTGMAIVIATVQRMISILSELTVSAILATNRHRALSMKFNISYVRGLLVLLILIFLGVILVWSLPVGGKVSYPRLKYDYSSPVIAYYSRNYGLQIDTKDYSEVRIIVWSSGVIIWSSDDTGEIKYYRSTIPRKQISDKIVMMQDILNQYDGYYLVGLDMPCSFIYVKQPNGKKMKVGMSELVSPGSESVYADFGKAWNELKKMITDLIPAIGHEIAPEFRYTASPMDEFGQ